MHTELFQDSDDSSVLFQLSSFHRMALLSVTHTPTPKPTPMVCLSISHLLMTHKFASSKTADLAR